MASVDWSYCPLVEVIPGKVSGAPLLKNTRLPVDAITGSYDAFRDEGLSPDAAIAETLDCYPEAGIDAIKAILHYRAEQFQAQPRRFSSMRTYRASWRAPWPAMRFTPSSVCNRAVSQTVRGSS